MASFERGASWERWSHCARCPHLRIEIWGARLCRTEQQILLEDDNQNCNGSKRNGNGKEAGGGFKWREEP